MKIDFKYTSEVLIKIKVLRRAYHYKFPKDYIYIDTDLLVLPNNFSIKVALEPAVVFDFYFKKDNTKYPFLSCYDLIRS